MQVHPLYFSYFSFPSFFVPPPFRHLKLSARNDESLLRGADEGNDEKMEMRTKLNPLSVSSSSQAFRAKPKIYCSGATDGDKEKENANQFQFSASS